MGTPKTERKICSQNLWCPTQIGVVGVVRPNRGNCSGHLVKDFIESYRKRPDGLFVDPSIGGGTSVDVARELGVRIFGTDLHMGFNLLLDDLKTAAGGEEAHLAFWHPPSMIAYSGNQWGQEADKWDMSRMSLRDFTEALELAVMNIHDAVERGVLMGNLSSLVERIAPGTLVDEIIKHQHN